MATGRILLTPKLRIWRTALARLFEADIAPAWMPPSLTSSQRILSSADAWDLGWATSVAASTKLPVTIIGSGPADRIDGVPDNAPLSLWFLDVPARGDIPSDPYRAAIAGALENADTARGKAAEERWIASGLPPYETPSLDAASGASSDALADAVLFQTAIYRDPYDGTRIDFEEAVDAYGFIRRRYFENDRRAFCIGVKWWNHKGVAALLSGKGGEPVFTDDFEAALAGAKASDGRVIAWSASATPERESASKAANVPFSRMEDGFLRSVGLGAALARGASAAFDESGIYFDATRPSDLETMLETNDLSDDDLERARSLREALVAARITKYNVGKRTDAESFPGAKKGILVPGQVADDAGILKTLSKTVDCSGRTNVNESLLAAVRKNNPDAYIVYKPHPDVEADLRKGRVLEETALRYADDIVRDVDILDLIDQCDRVETVSSLAGFEALLRGKEVTVHGMPFYAGWGLTTDLTTCERRTRKRSIDELLFFALIAYGRYIDPESMIHCRPERVIANLARLRSDPKHGAKYAFIKFISWFGRKIGL